MGLPEPAWLKQGLKQEEHALIPCAPPSNPQNSCQTVKKRTNKCVAGLFATLMSQGFGETKKGACADCRGKGRKVCGQAPSHLSPCRGAGKIAGKEKGSSRPWVLDSHVPSFPCPQYWRWTGGREVWSWLHLQHGRSTSTLVARETSLSWWPATEKHNL